MIEIRGKITGVEKFNGRNGVYYKYQISDNVETNRGNRLVNLFVKSKENGIKVGDEVIFKDCNLNPWVNRNGIAFVDIWSSDVEVMS